MVSDTEKSLFLSLFSKTPNLAVLHISDGFIEIQTILEELISSINGTLTFKNCKELDFEKFRLTARSFEYGVVCGCFDNTKRDLKFIKEIYHSLENSANIIIITNKKSNNLLYLYELLEQNDFRATNSIDIFTDYDLVVAKKMHMWGNGL